MGRTTLAVAAISGGLVVAGGAVVWQHSRSDSPTRSAILPTPTSTSAPAPSTARISTTSTTIDTHGLPPCIPLERVDGSLAGCELSVDYIRTRQNPTALVPGAPIYDHYKGAIVGYMTPTAGFVPKQLIPHLSQVISCVRTLNTAGKSSIDANCRAMLRDMGYPNSKLQ